MMMMMMIKEEEGASLRAHEDLQSQGVSACRTYSHQIIKKPYLLLFLPLHFNKVSAWWCPTFLFTASTQQRLKLAIWFPEALCETPAAKIPQTYNSARSSQLGLWSQFKRDASRSTAKPETGWMLWPGTGSGSVMSLFPADLHWAEKQQDFLL